ncbi:unnamed protein product [Ambrosiozyma monospora]|uniref:Unnamed protein product n=1 Tax=Ambrosiozyma monospora TaxID=43982 RepID=A0ACB5U1R9_AMBMO|nr:unnamed protein product [Ambrosiozyma monospora]
MVFSEAFAFELLTFLSAKFGNKELAAQSVVQTFASFAFNLPFAVAICSATRIGNIIGARSNNYHVAVKVMLSVACFFSVFNFAWMVLFRYPLARAFCEDETIVERTCLLFVVVGFNQFLDCVNIMCAGILRGQGRQRIGSILSIVSYYVIASPFELLFGFYFKMEVFGLWLGLAVGVGALSIFELVLVLKSDWEKIMEANAKIV